MAPPALRATRPAAKAAAAAVLAACAGPLRRSFLHRQGALVVGGLRRVPGPGVALGQVWRSPLIPAATARYASSSSPFKVAVIQDQQIPKEQALEVLQSRGLAVDWALGEASDATALVTVTAPVTEAVLDKHPNCKLVAVSFTGFNHVDLDACRRRGITVVNVPAYSTDAVAELAVGLALSVFREIPAAERSLRAGTWAHSAGGMELRDKVIGIVGLGDIGLRTAELFKAFKPWELLGWSRRPKAAFSAGPLGGQQVSMEELFDRSDVVSLHIALNAETKGIIGRSLLERLRPQSVLVNVARGGVCDQAALADLLSQRRFRAGLDVFETEPIPQDDPILKVPQDQVVLIPHIAYKSLEALRRRISITADNLRSFAEGKPQNVVFKP